MALSPRHTLPDGTIIARHIKEIEKIIDFTISITEGDKIHVDLPYYAEKYQNEIKEMYLKAGWSKVVTAPKRGDAYCWLDVVLYK